MAEDTMALFDKETDLVVMEPGQVLFRKGEAGRHMYIVKSGEVQIVCQQSYAIGESSIGVV